MAGCHSGLLLWLCVLSTLYPVAAADILLRRGSFVVLVCEEGIWLLWYNWDIFNREKRAVIKRVWLAMRGRKMNFKNAILICVHMCLHLHTQSDNYILRLRL